MSDVTQSDLALYSYFRSSAAFRVRIALNLKEVRAELRPIHLLKDGGQQHAADYMAINPQGLVPTLVHKGRTISQSLAIIEYLDEVVRGPALLPHEAGARAWVRQLACTVACDIHPLNNLRVLRYLRHKLGANDEARADWQHHWITRGLTALEKWLKDDSMAGTFCYGDAPTLADICLVPQLANARRINTDLEQFPTLLRIEKAAYSLPAFDAARAEKQPDAE